MVDVLDESVVTFANFLNFNELFLNKSAQPSFISWYPSGTDRIFNCRNWEVIFVPKAASLDLEFTVTLHSNHQHIDINVNYTI